MNEIGTKILTSNTVIACIYIPKYFTDSESPELNVLLMTDCKALNHFLVDLFEQTGHGSELPTHKDKK